MNEKILINSYNRNAGNHQNFTIQLNTPLTIREKSILKLEYFNMINGVYNFNGDNVFVMIETELDTSTSTTTPKQYNVAIPAGSYTPSDFANAAQTAITNASAYSGFGWNYTVSYNATTTLMTYNMTTTAPSGYIYSAYINSVDNYQISYLINIPVYFYPNNGVLLPASFTPHLSNYQLLITVNGNHHNHITTNTKKFSFMVPFNTADSTIIYNSNNNFENTVELSPQSFNNISIGITCLKFDPIINNDCVIFLKIINGR